MSERPTGHAPWCDTVLGPEFEVQPGKVLMSLHLCVPYECWNEEGA